MTSVFITTEVQNNGGVQTALAPIERRPLSGQSPAADRDASISGSGDEGFAWENAMPTLISGFRSIFELLTNPLIS